MTLLERMALLAALKAQRALADRWIAREGKGHLYEAYARYTNMRNFSRRSEGL